MAKIRNKKTGEIREVADTELEQYGLGGIHIDPAKKGSLHKALGIPEGEKIPAAKLKAKPGDSPALRKKKLFARNARTWDHEHGGLVKADLGTVLSNLQARVPDDEDPYAASYPISTNRDLGIDPLVGEEPKFNPALTRSVQDANRLNGKSVIAYGNSEEQQQFDAYNKRRDGMNTHWPIGFYPGLTEEFVRNAEQDKTMASYALNEKDRRGYLRSAGANTAGAVGAGFQSIANGVKNIVGPISGYRTYLQGKLAEQESFNLHNRERASIKPYRGVDDAPAMAMFGTDGKHFSGGPHNVEDEVDETVAIPPTGNHPGAVFVEGGKSHESGGNKRTFPGDTAIMSKRLAIKKEEAVNATKHIPEVSRRIAANGAEIMSHADVASLYDTSDLAEEHKILSKDLENLAKKKLKIEKSQTPNSTKVSQTTAKISNQTLNLKAKAIAERQAEIEEEMAYNSSVVRDVLLPIQESMKQQGMYGKKVQESGKEAAYGKKLKLPKAGVGKELEAEYDGTPYAKPLPRLVTATPATDPILGDTPNLYGELNQDMANKRLNQVNDEAGNLQDAAFESGRALIPFNTGLNPLGSDPAAKFTAPTAPIGPSVPKITPTKLKQPNNPASAVSPTSFNIWENRRSDVDWINKSFELNSKGPIPEFSADDIINYGLDPKDRVSIDNARSQRAKYRYARQTPEGQEALLRMMSLYGVTNRGEAEKIGIPEGDLTKIQDPAVRQQLLDAFEKAFVDGSAIFRWPEEKYVGNATSSTKAPSLRDDAVGALPKANVLSRKNNRYYQEGLHPYQIAGEIAGLLDGYEPAPYIEDRGAADALAANTRPQLQSDQAGHNRITRGLKALTRYNPQNAPFNAQAASNAWTAHNELTAQTANLNAQSEDRFQDRQNELRMRAGTNKANALRQLAVDTAKGHSAYTDRAINALSLMGNKYVQNMAENRAALLIQDMFPDIGYNPWRGTAYRGTTNLHTPGLDLDPQTAEEYRSEIAKIKLDQAELEYLRELNKSSKKKYGGKLPKKSIKSRTSVK